jgi:hypothetical protein
MRLTSRRPPASKCKAGKAERAPSSAAARAHFRWPQDGKDICHRDAHHLMCAIGRWLSTIGPRTSREWGAIGQAPPQNRSPRDSAPLRRGRLRQLLSHSVTAFSDEAAQSNRDDGGRDSEMMAGRRRTAQRPDIPARRLGRSPEEPDGTNCSIGVNVYMPVIDRKQIFISRNLRSKSCPRYFISLACLQTSVPRSLQAGGSAIGMHNAHGRSQPDSVDLSLSGRA